MSLRLLTGVFTGICVLVLTASTPVARAYVQGSDALAGKSSDGNASAKAPANLASWDKARVNPAERPWRNRKSGNEGSGGGGSDEASAPIPEPGTLTLASLGLLALGSAMRKRRGAQAPASPRIR